MRTSSGSQTHELTFPSMQNLAPGTKNVNCVIDPYNVVDELDEGNNSASTTFTVTAP